MSIVPSPFVQQVDRAREGCMESLGNLLTGYENYLKLIAKSELNESLQRKFSRSDLVQATYLQAKQYFHEFHGSTEGELLAWLRRILVSQLITEIRKYGTRKRDIRLEQELHAKADQSSAMMESVLPAGDDTPSQNAIHRERAVLLADALAKLPDDYQEVMVLRHLRGQPFAEIARQMGRSVDSVKAIWRRAILLLKQLVDQNMI